MEAPTRETWWYSNNEENWHIGGHSREDAIEAGRDDYVDGEPFFIGEGGSKGPWKKLFEGGEALAEFIDDLNDDRSFEDGFTQEASVTPEDLQPLCEAINLLWADFVDRTKPTSRLLDLRATETVPGTAEWIAQHEPETEVQP